MKITELTLRNFKRFGANTEPFRFSDDLGLTNKVTVLVGANGSGKSTILQSIAMLLGSAVRRSMQPNLLDWPGFNYEFIRSARRDPEVSAKVTFTNEEIQATQSFVEQLRTLGRDLELPGTDSEIGLQLDYARNQVLGSPNRRSLFQCKGYEYALQLYGGEHALVSNLKQVGGVYWYTEQRTAISITRAIETGSSEGSLSVSDSELRRILHEWDSFHVKAQRPGFTLRDGQRDRFKSLAELFRLVFPGGALVGSEPQPSPERVLDPPLFWLQDSSGREYELSSISAGERAILPMLIDFATWEIHNSIILIDEIELHLHPPLQQALMRALPRLGTNNQFIITTHSDHVVGMFSPSQVIRLAQ